MKENGLVLWLSEFEMRFLNNQPYQEFFMNWFENEINNIPRVETVRDLTVGYLSHSFSLMFFNLVLKYKAVLETKNINLKIEVFLNLDQDFSKYFASTIDENFPQVKMHFMNEINTQQRYDLDYMIFEPVDVKFGVLKKHLMSELMLIKSCNSNKSRLL